MPSIPVTFYMRSNGRTREADIQHGHEEDAKYLNDTGVKVSMEDLGGSFAIYFDYGAVIEDEPDEHIQICKSTDRCEDFMAKGVQAIKRLREEGNAD